jgi:hypothetical protein
MQARVLWVDALAPKRVVRPDRGSASIGHRAGSAIL